MSMRLAQILSMLPFAATLMLAQPQAIETYTAAIKLRSEDPQPHVLRGNVYKAIGQLPAAIANCQQAIHLGLQVPVVYNSLGAAFAALVGHQKASAAHTRALTLR